MTSSAPYKNILKLYLIMQWIMSDIFLKCPQTVDMVGAQLNGAGCTIIRVHLPTVAFVGIACLVTDLAWHRGGHLNCNLLA